MSPKKLARMEVLKELNNQEPTTRLGTMQSGLRIAYVALLLLFVGCTIMAIMPFAEHGIEYGLSVAPAYFLLFLFVLLLFAYPIYYLKTRQKDALDQSKD